jgi:hypothetical protein
LHLICWFCTYLLNVTSPRVWGGDATSPEYAREADVPVLIAELAAIGMNFEELPTMLGVRRSGRRKLLARAGGWGLVILCFRSGQKTCVLGRAV